MNDKSGYSIHKFDPETSMFTNGTVFVNGIPCMPINSTSMTVGVYDWNNNINLGLTTAHDLTNVFEVVETPLTSDEIALQKSVCSIPDITDNSDLLPILTTIADNTFPTSEITDKLSILNSSANIRNDKLTDLELLLISIDDSLKNNDSNSTSNNDTNSSTIINIESPLADIDTNLNDSLIGQNTNDIIDGSDDMDNFTNTFETTLTDTFTTYTDVFGFGVYGTAPAPITFSIIGKTFTIFDISQIGSQNIELIRNTFLLFAYLFGFILVFRTV
jgi:hypothetical protein